MLQSKCRRTYQDMLLLALYFNVIRTLLQGLRSACDYDADSWAIKQVGFAYCILSHAAQNMILRVLRLCVSLQHVSDFFVTSANAALSKSDEPEKVRRSLLQNGQLMSASLQAQLPVATLTCTCIRLQCYRSAHCCMPLSGTPVLMIAMNVL